jgi:chitosanase
MPHVIERVIACGRCAERSQFFAGLGFQILGCEPHPAQPGDCILRMVDPALEGQQAAPSAAVRPAGAVRMAAASAPAQPAALPAAPLTPLQTRAAQAIVNIFETSAVLGDYGRITVLAGDTGHLSYGRSQTTLGSGNLAKLVERYCASAGCRFGPRLAAYLPPLRERDVALDKELLLHNLLRAGADDPVMRAVQDQFFDQEYWQPALRACAKTGLRTPLAAALVYDGHVHGSWAALRDKTNADFGTVQALGEADWVARYIALRRAWLAAHPRKDLRATVYRMEAFQRLLDLGLWSLPLPFVVRGCEISEQSLQGLPPGCYDGPEPGTRALGLSSPLLRGLDVRLLQLGLSERGVALMADGVYGPGTRDAVRGFQLARGEPASGALDAAQVLALCS